MKSIAHFFVLHKTDCEIFEKHAHTIFSIYSVCKELPLDIFSGQIGKLLSF
jgi:hypothetical protein